MKRILLAGALAAGLAFSAHGVALAGGHAASEGLIEATSPHDVATTVEKLKAAVENAGAKVAATIDHQANAASVGTEMPATTLVMFGNPKVGTPLIAASRTTALDLPVRVLVYDDGGTTKLIATAPSTLVERHGIEGADEAVKRMTGAIEKLMAAAGK